MRLSGLCTAEIPACGLGTTAFGLRSLPLATGLSPEPPLNELQGALLMWRARSAGPRQRRRPCPPSTLAAVGALLLLVAVGVAAQADASLAAQDETTAEIGADCPTSFHFLPTE